MELKGELVTCPHCGGTGICHNSVRLQDDEKGKAWRECPKCGKGTLENKYSFDQKPPVCAICDGKGRFWIGPSLPNEVQEHTHTHTHEAPAIDESLLQQLSSNFSDLLEKLGEITERQSGGIDQSLAEELTQKVDELIEKIGEMIEQQSEILSRITDVIEGGKATMSKRRRETGSESEGT